MIDIDKSETSAEDSIKHAESLPKQPELQAQPTEQPVKLSFTDLGTKITSLPATINQSLDDGGGDSVIHAIQDIIQTVVAVIFSSCRIISLRACLLPETEKNNVSKIVYVISFYMLAIFLITLLVSFSWGTVFLCFECLGAAYTADRVLHSSYIDLRRKREKNRNVSSRKSRQIHDDDSDYL